MTKYAITLQNPNLNEMGVHATIDFYRTMALDEKHSDSYTAVATGVGSPFLNMVVHSQLRAFDIDNDIIQIKQFFNKHFVPWTWSVSQLTLPVDFEKILLQHQFSLLEEAPSMVCDLTAFESQENSTDLKIEELVYPSHLKKWFQVIHEGFGDEEDDDNSFQILNEKLLYTSPHKLRHYIGKIHDEVVCAGTLFISKDSVMIHNVATKKAFLRKGYGRALTQHMMLEAKKLGFQYCFLDSSESGYNMYHNLGFRTYGLIKYYKIKD